MKKLQHVQRTISLTTGDAQKEIDFSDIQGPVVGYSTVPFGTIPAGQTADVMIKDGATTVLMPIDIAVSNVKTKNSFEGSVCPLTVENPGRITGAIIPSTPLGAGEAYKVKVIIYYTVDTAQGYAATSIKDCI